MKKLLCLLLGIVMILSLSACSSGGAESYEDAVDLYGKILACNISEDEFKSICPDTMWEYAEEKIGKTFEAVYATAEVEMQNQRNVAVSTFGEDFTVTYKILDKSNTSAEKVAELKNHLSKNFDIASDSIGSCYDVNVLFTVSGSKDQQEQEVPICIIEIDGAWYLADLFTEFL